MFAVPRYLGILDGTLENGRAVVGGQIDYRQGLRDGRHHAVGHYDDDISNAKVVEPRKRSGQPTAIENVEIDEASDHDLKIISVALGTIREVLRRCP